MTKKLHQLATLYVDQHGFKIYARSVKELKEKAGPGRINKMYQDRRGGVFHAGYCIGGRWFEAYAPVLVAEAPEQRSEQVLDRLAMRKARRLVACWGAAGLSISGDINGCWILSKYTDQPGNPIEGSAFCTSGREVLEAVRAVIKHHEAQA